MRPGPELSIQALTLDRASGVATQTTAQSSILMVDTAGASVTEVVAESSALSSFATADTNGRLYYTTRVPGGWATYRHDAGGGSTLVAPDLWRAIPAPDARFLIGRHPERGLMRVNADRSGATVILPDASTAPAAFTPGGAGFVYVSNQSGPQQPWRVTLSSGETLRLSDVSVDNARFWLSRDGREVSFGTRAGTRICGFPAFEPCRAPGVLAGPLSADGKTAFAIDPNDPRNILVQPIDGSPPTPLTHFTDKEIFDFSLTPTSGISRLPVFRVCVMSCL